MLVVHWGKTIPGNDAQFREMLATGLQHFEAWHRLAMGLAGLQDHAFYLALETLWVEPWGASWYFGRDRDRLIRQFGYTPRIDFRELKQVGLVEDLPPTRK